MSFVSTKIRSLVLGVTAALLLAGTAGAAEVRVMILGRLDGGLQGIGAGVRAHHRQQGADRLRALDGDHRQRHPGRAEALQHWRSWFSASR